MSCDADVVVIGAGLIGLAVASQIAREGREVYILEKNETFGRETSSRNSGVIHTSLLNPQGSWNARLCLEGNPLIYQICREYGVDHRRTGKLLVAHDADEENTLQAMFQRNIEGIRMRWLSRREMGEIEPEVKGSAAVLLADSGVADAYGLMRCYLGLACNTGAQLVCRAEAVGIETVPEGYRLSIRDPEGVSTILTRVVINCAGLNSDRVAALAGIDIVKAGYKLNYYKGEYYSISSGKSKRFNQRLIYPLLRSGGLIGIHTVLDIDGRVRLGPDFYRVPEIDYSIDDTRKDIFYEGMSNLVSGVEYEDIEPESAGIMPRLYVRAEDFRDFIIRHEEDRGLTGLINLIGIETPGLTASPAIARYVSGMVEEILRN